MMMPEELRSMADALEREWYDSRGPSPITVNKRVAAYLREQAAKQSACQCGTRRKEDCPGAWMNGCALLELCRAAPAARRDAFVRERAQLEQEWCELRTLRERYRRKPLSDARIDALVREADERFDFGKVAEVKWVREFARAIERAQGIGDEAMQREPHDEPPVPGGPYNTVEELLASIGADHPTHQAQAARDVLAERLRQVLVEGWTSEHDDHAHDAGDLAFAAAAYALDAGDQMNPHSRGDGGREVPDFWPWWNSDGRAREPSWWKPTDPRRNLVKAGALILAEIERIDRAARAAKEE